MDSVTKKYFQQMNRIDMNREPLESAQIESMNSPNQRTNWKRAGDTVIAAQKLQKMERLNRGRKRFNAAIGFTKLEDPRTRLLADSGPDDDVDMVDGLKKLTITPGFDKYRRMKQIASFFAISGIVYGGLLIFFGDNYGALIPENKSFFGSDLTKQENKAEIEVCVADTGLLNPKEFLRRGTWFITMGSVIIGFSVMGIFAIRVQLTLLFILYNIYCIVGTIMTVGLVAITALNFSRFVQNWRYFMRDMWLATARTDLSWIRAIERRFGCCGYYNVFDYCCMDQMSTIMGVAGDDYRKFIDGLEDLMPEREPFVAPKSTVLPRTGPIQDDIENPDAYSVVDGERDDFNSNYGTVYGYSSEYGTVDGSPDDGVDFEYGYGEYVDDYSEMPDENFEDITKSPNNIPQLRTSDPNDKSTSGGTCTPSSDNEYCVCDKAEETGRLAQLGFLTMTCKFNVSTRDPIMVRDSCPTKFDSLGNEICQLNGCADMLTAPVAGVAIPLVIIFTGCQIFIYFFGLYCSLQLNFYYWKEYNLRIEKRRKDNADKANWRHRLELEKETVLDTVDSITSRFSRRTDDPSNDPNHNENSNVTPNTNRDDTNTNLDLKPEMRQKVRLTNVPRPVIDSTTDNETEKLLQPALKRQSTLDADPDLLVSNVQLGEEDSFEP